jgi:nitrate/nitrite transporter NarK
VNGDDIEGVANTTSSEMSQYELEIEKAAHDEEFDAFSEFIETGQGKEKKANKNTRSKKTIAEKLKQQIVTEEAGIIEYKCCCWWGVYLWEKLKLKKFLSACKEIVSSFRDRNYTLVWTNRFVFSLCFGTVVAFLQYYMRDVIQRPYDVLGLIEARDPEEAVALFTITTTLGALFSALVGGLLSDRIGHRISALMATVVMAMVPAVFVFLQNFTFSVLLGVVFGFGYGSYVSVSFALVSAVLPSRQTHAQDLGTWTISENLPLVIGPAVGGLMIDFLNPLGNSIGIAHLGYKIMYAMTSTLLLSSSILIFMVDLPTKALSKY